MTSPGNTLSYAGRPPGPRSTCPSSCTCSNGSLCRHAHIRRPARVAGGRPSACPGPRSARSSGLPRRTPSTPAPPVDDHRERRQRLFVVTSGGNTLTAGTGSASLFLFDGAAATSSTAVATARWTSRWRRPASTSTCPAPGEATGGFGGTPVADRHPERDRHQLRRRAHRRGARPDPHRAERRATCSRPAPPEATPSSRAAPAPIPSVPSELQRADRAAGGNTMIGGSGDDVFFAQNGVVDTITGQAGDTAYVDPQDIVTGTGIRHTSRMTPPRPCLGGGLAVTVNVALIGAENLFVTPGESATCQLSIANASTIVEQFTLLALGEAMEWVVPEPPVVSLFPGGPADGDVAVLAAAPAHHSERRGAVRGQGHPFHRAGRVGDRRGGHHGRVVQRRRRRAGAQSHDRPDHRPPEAGGRQPRQRPGAGRGHRPGRRRRPEVQDAAPPPHGRAG